MPRSLRLHLSRPLFVPDWPSSFGSFVGDVAPGAIRPSGLVFEDDFESAGTALWWSTLGWP